MSVPGPPAPASGGFPQRPSHVTGTVDLDRQPLVPGPGGGQIKPLEISTGGAPSDHNPTPLFPPAELELKLEELLVCAKTLKSRLPTMMEKALETIKTPLLVFHHRPKDGRGSTEANQNRKILEFLLVLVGVWKLEFPEENPDGVCLVLVDENKLVTAMALSMPYRNPESARMRPWEMACDWLNFFALVPPVTIFDPSKMTLNSLISSRGGPSTPATTSESTSYTSIPLAKTSEASGLAVLLSASEAMENKDSSSTSASASSSSSSSGAQSPSFQGKKEKEKPKLSVLKGIVKKKDSKPSWDRRSRSSSDSDSDSKSKASEFIYKEYQPGDQDSDSKRKRGQMTKKERAWHLTEILKGCAAFNPKLHRTFQTYLFRPNENDPPRETDLHFFEGLRDSGLLVRKPLEPTVEKEIGEVYCITKDQESLLPLWKGRGLNPKQSISSALSRAFAHCHSYTLPLTVSGTLLIPPPTSPVTPPRANDPIPVPTPTAPTAVTSLPTESSTSNSKPDGEEVQKSC